MIEATPFAESRAVSASMLEVGRSGGGLDRLRWRDYALLIAFAWLVGLGGVLGRPLANHDELRVAGIARAMALSGDYVTPRLNGHPFLEYPSLGYVPAAVALRIARRPSELAARLPSAILGGLTVCLAAWAGATVGGRRRGLTTGLLLLTTFGFTTLTQKLVVDSMLVLFVTLSLAGFIHAWRFGSRLSAACFWIGMAAGFLAKGLIGIGVPLVTAFGFLAVLEARKLWRGGDEIVLRPIGWIWGPLLLAAPIALWMWAVERSGGASLSEEAIRQSAFRFAATQADHAAPWYEYLRLAPAMTLPLLPIAVVDLWASRRRGDRMAPPLGVDALFGAVWFGLTLAALSIASAKRAMYLAPLYPGAALIGAVLWERVRARVPVARACAYGWLVIAAVGSISWPHVDASQKTRTQGMRELFALVESERADRRLVLFRPSEGLMGAATFFTSETVPEANTLAELEPALGRHRGAVIVTDEKSGDGDPDRAPPGTETRRLGEFAPEGRRTQVWSIDPRG